MATPAGGFELLEHTADVGVRATGPSVRAVFEQATLGLAEVLGVWRPGRPGAATPVGVEAGDLGGLLVDWLNEVLWLHEVHGGAAIGDVRVERVTGDRASGWVTLVPAGGQPADGTPVKAVTYHRLRVEQEPHGWVAEVYFDV